MRHKVPTIGLRWDSMVNVSAVEIPVSLFTGQKSGAFYLPDWKAITASVEAAPDCERGELWKHICQSWAQLTCDSLNTFLAKEAPRRARYAAFPSARMIVV